MHVNVGVQTSSELVREAHGLEPLVVIIKDKNVRENKPLLAAATGAIWKCAASDENVKQFDNVGNFLWVNLENKYCDCFV